MTIAPSAKEIQKQIEAKKAEVKAVKHVEVNPNVKPVDLDSFTFKKFVVSAPDGSSCHVPAKSRLKLKGKKVVVTIQLEPDQVDELDYLAQSLGKSRSELVRILVQQAIDNANPVKQG